MNNIRLLSEGLGLLKTFGIRHTIQRYRDYSLSRSDERRRTRLYDRLKPDEPIVKNVLGNLMRLDVNDQGIHRDLFLDGIREPIATAHAMRVLSCDDVVLEIGANVGYYVLLTAQRCKHVYAVEPHPRNIEHLKQNLSLNSFDNVSVYQMALGDTQGTAKMNVSNRANWHSFRPTRDVKERIEVKMDTVDHFLEDKPPPTFARMDVEGYELNVIRGMTQTLTSLTRLFIELHADILELDETRELLDTLENAGFRPELIARYDRPTLGRVVPTEHIAAIHKGDKANYEIFFVRGTGCES